MQNMYNVKLNYNRSQPYLSFKIHIARSGSQMVAMWLLRRYSANVETRH